MISLSGIYGSVTFTADVRRKALQYWGEFHYQHQSGKAQTGY